MSSRKHDREPLGFLILFGILALIIAMAFSFTLTSCSPKIIHEIETRVEYRDRIIHDTATFEVVKEVEKNVTKDTTSHLENSWAKSDAVISEGLLWHSLESKPQIIKVPYQVEVHDTLYIQTEAQVIEKPVEKPLSWWKKFKMEAFPWLLVLLVLTNLRRILKWLSMI